MDDFPIWVLGILAITTILNIIVPISGSATITPLLAIFTDTHTAIALTAFFFAMGNIPRIYFFRKTIRWELVKELLPVSIIGAIIGALAIIQIDSTILLGIVIIFTLYFLYKTIKKMLQPKKEEKKEKENLLSGNVVGILSGFLQGSGLAGSDLRNGYLYSNGVTLSEIHGTTAIVGTVNAVIATLIRLGTNQITIPDLTPLLILFPIVIVSVWAGKKILFKLDRKIADGMVVFVMVAAIVLLIQKLLFA